jgi:Rps23 Pro-64 3,4-dihydroxylase Tpa1-like proline 4-hydroxylase
MLAVDQSPVQSTLPAADATPDDALLPYRIYGDFLSREHHAALLAWALDNQSRFAPSAVGGVAKSVQPTVRQSLFLRDLGPLEAVLRQRITEQLPQVFADFSTRPFTLQGIELELVAHNDGAFYRRHIDTVTTDRPGYGDRIFSGVYYFWREPKGFSEGQLRLYRLGSGSREDGHFPDIPPPQNGLVAFRSWWPHEVRPVRCPSGQFADSRFAVNCWVYRARQAEDEPPAPRVEA